MASATPELAMQLRPLGTSKDRQHPSCAHEILFAVRFRGAGGLSAKSAQPASDPGILRCSLLEITPAQDPSPWRASHSLIGLRGPRTPNHHPGPINAVIRIPKVRLQLISD